ncbi:MAG: nucleotidyl transferase AbiEii/AbiGii toxin family protein [Propionibacteriaceae bacterium]|nr:nucleotidyl transferase AbiEii/AbiGii toxin family protein [Propionibacteriaceae bacterium]
MSHYDKAALGIQATERGFIRDTFEKMLRLSDILAFITADPLLAGTLALKGGTAINLTIFDLPRLSVDIDLDYMRNNSTDEMFAHREQINLVIARYMAGQGYTTSRKTRGHHALDAVVWSYTNSAGMLDNIKIEINYSMRAHVLEAGWRRILPLDKGDVITLAPIEIYASKIVALLTRAAPRDLYDVNHMIEADMFASSAERDLLRRCVVFYLALTSDGTPDPTNDDNIWGITQRRIVTQLQPVLRKRDRFDLVTCRHRVTEYLATLLHLGRAEQEFLDAFRMGQWRPELIFEGDCLDRVRHHPMAAWKLAHVRDGESAG